jgi:uncharacterized protein (TIGR02996 family)
MHDEEGFLSTIRQTPADDVARLVFADWLDEQDDPICKLKAGFIRLELRMAEIPKTGLNRIRWLNQLQKLAAKLPPAWLAVVSHPKLERCRYAFQFECAKQWEKLTPTTVANVRFCEGCKKNVHYCDTLQEAQRHSAKGHCVALSVALIRKSNDLLPPLNKQIRLTPDQIERLGRLSASRVIVGEPLPYHELPPPPPVPEWSPQPEPEEREDRRPKPRHRKKRRPNHRNIQRENWEEMG